MIAYHCDTNAILQASFATISEQNQFAAYNCIMKRLTDKGHKVDIQILDNESSYEYKRVITEKLQAQYQLVPPNVHQRNAAEQVICMFKAHFLFIFAGVDPDFPMYMWDTLIQQTDLTINLLCQATINPKISVWDYFNGPFDYAATPLGPLVSRVMIHNTVNTRKSWYQRGQECFYIVPALQNYQCLTVFDNKTKHVSISDTVDFLHTYLQQPTLTPEDRIVNAVYIITCAIQYVKSNNTSSQLVAIQ